MQQLSTGLKFSCRSDEAVFAFVLICCLFHCFLRGNQAMREVWHPTRIFTHRNWMYHMLQVCTPRDQHVSRVNMQLKKYVVRWTRRRQTKIIIHLDALILKKRPARNIATFSEDVI